MDQQAVLVFTRRGHFWRVHSPDFPGICQEGPSIEVLCRKAALDIRRELIRLAAHGRKMQFRSYAVARIDDVWSRREGIHWTAAIIRTVTISKPAGNDLMDDSRAERAPDAFPPTRELT